MIRFAPLKVAVALVALSAAPMAMASPACTKVPEAKWLTPAQMKARIAKMGYRDIKVFQVSGSCYEIYAHTKKGKRAEVYFNPVNGAVVHNNVD
ncbi:PepSY domain-containing protein [Sphingomonas sp. GlSt437]